MDSFPKILANEHGKYQKLSNTEYWKNSYASCLMITNNIFEVLNINNNDFKKWNNKHVLKISPNLLPKTLSSHINDYIEGIFIPFVEFQKFIGE